MVEFMQKSLSETRSIGSTAISIKFRAVKQIIALEIVQVGPRKQCSRVLPRRCSQFWCLSIVVARHLRVHTSKAPRFKGDHKLFISNGNVFVVFAIDTLMRVDRMNLADILRAGHLVKIMND